MSRTFLLSARKRKKSKSSYYLISTSKMIDEDDRADVVAKVRSNFIGTTFTLYDDGGDPDKSKLLHGDSTGIEPEQSAPPIRRELGCVLYEPNVLGFKGPRRMTVALPSMTKAGKRIDVRPTCVQDTLVEKFKRQDGNVLVLINKSPQVCSRGFTR